MDDVESAELSIDDVTIRELQGLGIDFSRSLGTHHFLYFGSRAAAVAAGKQLRQNRFDVSVARHPVDKRQWSVIASDETIVVPANMRLVRAAMTRIANQFGGEYDGWEAAIHMDENDPLCPLCDEMRGDAHNSL